jgi:hypothetical protein
METPGRHNVPHYFNDLCVAYYAISAVRAITSNVPVGAMALRGRHNERGDFLMSTLPVLDTGQAPSFGARVIPHFANGAGWTTEILLVNPKNNAISGTVESRDEDGGLANVTLESETRNTFPYSIPPRTSRKLIPEGGGAAVVSGSVRLNPNSGSAAPTPLVVFGFKPAGVTLSEASVPAVSGKAFRAVVEYSGSPGQPGSILSGIAIANDTPADAAVVLELMWLDGTPTGLKKTLAVRGLGHVSGFAHEFFQDQMPFPFQGILKITTASSAVSIVGLRSRFNENQDFLITTMTPSDEATAPAAGELVFPQLADGAGYTTQFILFSGSGEPISGIVRFIDPSGRALPLTLR